MTDKELIQAFRYCEDYSGDLHCKSCPYNSDCSSVTMTTAADRLEALLAENERLKAQLPKWVSVKERMPEVGATVLVCDYDGHIETGERNGSGWIGGWLDECAAYWMPLPSTEGVE